MSNKSSKNTLNQYNRSDANMTKSQTIIPMNNYTRNNKMASSINKKLSNVPFTTVVSPREAESVNNQ